MKRRVQVVEKPLVQAASLARGLALHCELVAAGAEVAVVDLNTAGAATQALIGGLRERGARVLALSSSAEPGLVALAIRAGADGFLVGVAGFDELAQAIEALAAGRQVYGPEVAHAFADPDADLLEVVDAQEWELEPVRNGFDGGDAAQSETLSPREAQILRLVATGHSSQTIADSLAISVQTVRKHRENLMRKLDLHNVAEVTAFALRRNLLAPPAAPGVT
jgi:DNA-binding NarL/FixJ family response regulator